MRSDTVHRREDPLSWALLMAAPVLIALLGSPALGAEPTPPPRVHWATYTGTATLFHAKGSDRKAIVFARADFDWTVRGRAHVFGRLDGSATGDGAVTPSLNDPATYTTAELYLGARYEVTSWLSATAVGGRVWSLETGVPAPNTLAAVQGGGLILGDLNRGRWLMALACKHDLDPTATFCPAAQLQVDGRVSLVGDAILGGTSRQVRVGVVVRGPGNSGGAK